MAAAQRVAANAAMDAGLSAITAQIPGWIANGGGRNTIVKAVLAALAASDQGLARVIERKWGSSALAKVPTTITLADTSL